MLDTCLNIQTMLVERSIERKTDDDWAIGSKQYSWVCIFPVAMLEAQQNDTNDVKHQDMLAA